MSLPDPAAVPPPLTATLLPDDVATLQRLVLELLASLQQHQRDNESLRHRLDLLLRRLYGPRSERLDPNQLLLFAALAAAAAAAARSAAEESTMRTAPEPEPQEAAPPGPAAARPETPSSNPPSADPRGGHSRPTAASAVVDPGTIVIAAAKPAMPIPKGLPGPG